MAIFQRAAKLFVTAAAAGFAGVVAASAQPATPRMTTVNPSLTRPEFTRPAGITGSARTIALNEKYLMAPAQPANPVVARKRKKR